mmetsp:Transcript_31827/g.102821  ORF Transcript_31827/g.102821 Transcript_31827/m.102821 type:complete len:218 (+) Transcript_31827:386-1039(+)
MHKPSCECTPWAPPPPHCDSAPPGIPSPPATPSAAPRSLGEDALVLVNEPLLRLGLCALVLEPNLRPLRAPLGHTAAARPPHDHEEVHAIDAGARVVLQPEVDVLHDAEAKVSGVGEVGLAQLVLLDLEATLQQLLSLLTTNGHVARNLLIPPDAERAHGEPGFREDGLLAAQILQHLGGTGETIARLADRDVENELLDLHRLHRVRILIAHAAVSR